jgi:hypothetical protein
VRTQDFGENENQNHADEQPRLLRSSTDTSISHNSNGEAGSETSQTDSETSTELDETSEESVVILLETVGDQDGDDEAVDTDDTSHNDGDDVCWKVLCQHHPSR